MVKFVCGKEQKRKFTKIVCLKRSTTDWLILSYSMRTDPRGIVDIASEHSCSVAVTDRCVVTQYHSFVTMLGAGAARPNYCISAVSMQCSCAVNGYMGREIMVEETASKIFDFCQANFAPSESGSRGKSHACHILDTPLLLMGLQISASLKLKTAISFAALSFYYRTDWNLFLRTTR